MLTLFLEMRIIFAFGTTGVKKRLLQFQNPRFVAHWLKVSAGCKICFIGAD